ncbi:MAG: glycosyl transferase [Desulfatiglandales bacterium]
MNILSLYHYAGLFLGSLLFSLCLTPLVRRAALATGQVAVPKDSRWHKKETALMGGVAIFAATLGPWFLVARFSDWHTLGLPFLPLLLCATGIFVLGLVDDIITMDPQHKLVGQFVISSILVFFGFRLEWTSWLTLNLLISIVWIVGITNAFNLLDNMDGLSAGVAFIAGAFLFLTTSLNPGHFDGGGSLLMCAALLGALLGFLFYNFNPASIFMGDAGSLFIGFLLTCLTMTSGAERAVAGPVRHFLSVIAIPLLILFIPILDTGFVSVMRKLFQRPISQGGRDHSSHRLVAIGFSERKAVLVLYGFSIVSGLIALTINRLSIGSNLVLILFYLLLVILFWVYLAKVKVYEEGSILENEGLRGLTPLLVQITFKRRLLEVLLDFVLVTLAYYVAYLLRFEGPVYYMIGPDFGCFLKSLPIVLACQIFCFYALGIYRGTWESAGLSDVLDYMKAVVAGTVLTMLILLFLYRFQGFSRAVFVIYGVLLLIFVFLSRFSFRMVDERIKKGDRRGKPTLIYGAGVGGQMVVREVESNRNLQLALVGFIDDDPGKYRRKIKGYPVLGGRDDLEKIISEHHIQEIIVSFSENGAQRKREIREQLQKKGAEVGVKHMRMVLE